MQYTRSDDAIVSFNKIKTGILPLMLVVNTHVLFSIGDIILNLFLFPCNLVFWLQFN